MEGVDLFDLVGITFDPPETNAKQIRKKIDKKKEELGSALGRATQDVDRKRLQDQIRVLESAEKDIFDQDGKKLNNAVLESMAKKKLDAVIQNLSSIVEMLAMNGSRSVKEAAIKYYKKETRLSDERVKKVFRDAGFDILESNPLQAYPKFPMNANLIYENLAALRRTKDPNPNGADTSIAVDLYAFAAYISNDPNNIAMYRAMSTSELCSLFSEASRRFSQRNDDLGKLCGTISTAAKTYVFDQDSNRDAYKLYLLYQSDELRKVFENLKHVPESTKLTPSFADTCIGIINKYFPDYDVALAIYNKEAGFSTEWYEPIAGVYTVQCSYCGKTNKFESEAAAISSNSCQNCKRELYKRCKKCGKMVLIQSEACPNPQCRYVFANEALFPGYFQKAEEALRNNDFDVARSFLNKARVVAPNQKEALDRLEGKIDREERQLKEPIEKLKRLVAERRFQQAGVELVGLKANFPTFDTTKYEKTINDALRDANVSFADTKSKGLSSSQIADICVKILMRCVDYEPAVSFLRVTPPIPCNSIEVVPNSATRTVNISWSRSREQGVSYRLVRKAGKVGAKAENDGEILADDAEFTSFTDNSAIPGQPYSYTVFASRMKVYASSITKTVTLHSDVGNVRVSQRGSEVRLTWDAPINSRGATVTRFDNISGKNVVVADRANGSFAESGLPYGTPYTYCIVANYADNGRSQGVDVTITLVPTVDAFTIQASCIKDNTYRVEWSIVQRGINLRVKVNDRVYAEAKSEDRYCQIDLPPESFCVITVAAYSDSKWINSENTVELNTYSACDIDKKSTVIAERTALSRNERKYFIDLRIVLCKPIPTSVVGFYYVVRDSQTPKDKRWAKAEEIGKTSDCSRVTIGTYDEKGCILYQSLANDQSAYYITVFTIHLVSGREIVSEPKKLRVNRPLSVNVLWSVKVGMISGVKLSIEMIGNRPIEYIPSLVLYCNESGRPGKGCNDVDSHVVMRIEGGDIDFPHVTIEREYSEKTDVAKGILKSGFYSLSIDSDTGKDSFSPRWKDGFTGKAR